MDDDARHYRWCQQEDCVLLPGPGLERDNQRRGIHRSRRTTVGHSTGEQLAVRVIAIVREPHPDCEVVVEFDAPPAPEGGSGSRVALSLDPGEARWFARQLLSWAAVAGDVNAPERVKRNTARGSGAQCRFCGCWTPIEWPEPDD